MVTKAANKVTRPKDPERFALFLAASYDACVLGQTLTYRKDLLEERGEKPAPHWRALAKEILKATAQAEGAAIASVTARLGGAA